ncbi:MAG: hypothetical protein KKD43_02670 [Gammaproteobacteria bacterium]|nr:hypothetical protein [Gammaproteobacteria bacterium]
MREVVNPLIPILVNILVIGVIAAELIATALGEINADRLLIVSTISGGLTIFSMRLSQQALDRLKQDNELEDKQLQTERRGH